ncbi:sensor histidine kinase [Azospirillum sp.]|uniref:sensor histidine kinase n=1 Tax=Azospirillum sp. TaxID=34012 RepID=UPI003D758470
MAGKGAMRTRRLGRDRLAGYAALACLGVVAGVFGLFAVASYDRLVTRAEQQAHDTAFFFADHGSRLFEAADLATSEAVAALEGEPWEKVSGSRRAAQALERLSDRFPYTDALFLTDAEGRIRLVSNSFPAPDVDVSDREYFTSHRDGRRGLYVSRLLISRTTGNPGFVLSRGIYGDDGEFRGVAAAIIATNYLAEFYRSINLPFDPTISLFRSDFQPLVRQPGNVAPDNPGRLQGEALIRKAIGSSPSTELATVSGKADGEELILGYAKIENVPLYVSVAIDRPALLRVWFEESRVPGAMAAVALAALGALTIFVFRQARRDEEAKRLLESTVEARTSDLRSANRQLEVLVQEVHHRVKNNLQVISSMLRLQSIQMSDDGVRKALQDSVNRVHAMSLVHEMLSGAGDRAGLEFREYLRDLTDQLKESYGAGDRVAIAIECDDLTLDMTQGILLALIVNEIFSNALKHAFPPGHPGELRIALERQGARARLTMRDNGIGLPPGFDWRKASSLGLQIVQSLAAKLGGEASLTAAGSTCFTLVFPLGNGAAADAELPADVVGAL